MLRLDRYDFVPAPRAQVPRFHRRVLLGVATVVAAVVLTSGLTALGAPDHKTSNREAIERGKYLVTLGGCTDCHTPGYFFGKPDMGRFLGGSEVGFEIPGLGVFHGPNLTPDNETGLGTWSEQEIVTAITAGRRPDGRELAPIMPWRAFANLTPEDAKAMAAYLKSLPPVKNKVPGPIGPIEKAPSFVMKIVAPDATPRSNAAQ
jgi:mono/diheme cytochrome c family protein